MAAGGTDRDFKLVTPDDVVECDDGDDVTLHCHLSPETSAVAMEIRWFRETDSFIYLYKNGHVTEGRGYEGRVSVDPQELQRGGVSLRLRSSRRGDGGVYTCQVISGEHMEEGRVELRIIVAVGSAVGLRRISVSLGDELFVPAVVPAGLRRSAVDPFSVLTGRRAGISGALSGAAGSAVDFKLVTPDHVVECDDGDDVTLRCHLSPKTSAVAMEIRWFRETDCVYLYKNGHVTEGRGYEGRVSVDPQELQRGDVSLRLSGFRRGDGGVYTCQVISGEHMEEGRVELRIIVAVGSAVGLRRISVSLGDELFVPAVVPAGLRRSAVDPFSVLTGRRAGISGALSGAAGSAVDFKLVTPDHVVECDDGDDVTLRCHLSPKTSAVAMEIRWFRETDCVYLYKNGHVTEGRGYEGRVSVDPQELQRGDVSLRLSGFRRGDGGVYTCQVISGEHMEEGRVGLMTSASAGSAVVRMISAEERKKMEESVQSLPDPDQPPIRRRRSKDEPPNMGGESPGPAPPVSP